MYSTDNGWKPEGALGGFLGGVGASYGMEEMDDANRTRDLADAIKQHELDQSLLDDPVKARKRQYELESEIPTKTAKDTTDRDWNTSGNARKALEEKLIKEQQDNEKQRYAQAAVKRGDWVIEGSEKFKMGANGILQINDDDWKEWMDRKPEDVKYMQGNLPTPENLQRLNAAARAATMSMDVVRKIAEGQPKIVADAAEHDKNRTFLGSEADKNRANQLEVARTQAEGRKKVDVSDSYRRLVSGSADEEDIVLVERDLLKQITMKDEGAKLMSTMRGLAQIKGKTLETMSDAEYAQIQQSAQRALYPKHILAAIEKSEAAIGKRSPPPAPVTGGQQSGFGGAGSDPSVGAMPATQALAATPVSSAPMPTGTAAPAGEMIRTTASGGIPYVVGADGKAKSDPEFAAKFGDKTTPLDKDEEWVNLPGGGRYRRKKGK